MSRLILTFIVGLLAIANVYAVDRDPHRPYIIYPQVDLSLRESEELTGVLDKLAVGKDSVYIHKGSEQSKPIFWLVRLSYWVSESLRYDSRIKDIHENEDIAEPFREKKSARTHTRQVTDATFLKLTNSTMTMGNALSSAGYMTQLSPEATELRVLSQPRGTDSIKQYENYVYPVGGSEIYIYHAELGINRDHEEFQDPQRRIEWVYTPLAEFYGYNTENESPAANGHSTCTASKATGNMYGANRQATLVVVKMPDWSEASSVQILTTIADHIRLNGRQARSVVSVSWGLTVTGLVLQAKPYYHYMLQAMDQMLSDGVVVVCAAGNSATQDDWTGSKRLLVDTAPAIFRPDAANLIVVGNSDNAGARHSTSQRLKTYQIHAPGVDIKCAKSTSTRGYEIDTGTSYSAPLVAGVIADYLAKGHIDSRRLSPHFLRSTASWRRSGGEYVIWNGVDRSLNPPSPWNTNITIVPILNSSFPTTTIHRTDTSNIQTS